MDWRKSADGWSYLQTVCAKEAERCRHCRGCIYFGIAWTNGCCDYYLTTGKRRPNKFGVKDCAVKVVVDRVPQKHLDWCDEIDRREADKQAGPAKPKKRGRPMSWDVEYAQVLYNHGYYYFEIAEILGTTNDAVSDYSSAHFWTETKPHNVCCTRHDLSVEPARYARYREQRNNGQISPQFVTDLFGLPQKSYDGHGICYGVTVKNRGLA